jgi:hypothetical protein
VVVLQQGSTSGALRDCWVTAAVQRVSDPRLLVLLEEQEAEEQEQEGP